MSQFILGVAATVSTLTIVGAVGWCYYLNRALRP